MNRLAPLVHRADPRPGPARLTAMRAAPFQARIEPDAATRLADDVRLFATGWAGGLVFFGTMLA
jgi:hypothetical protein